MKFKFTFNKYRNRINKELYNKRETMNNHDIVNNYLADLGFDNNIKTLEDITKLIQAHLNTFAFSSLKVLLKEPISLELSDIYTSIVVQKRGGYCFEHNKLFFEVLKELGFDVTFYLARVVNNSNSEVPQTHRFTLIHYEEDYYLIDVGIGFHSPCAPIKFSGQPTPSHLDISYTVQQNIDKTYVLQSIAQNIVFAVTKFDLHKCYEADFEMGHFYSSQYPQAVFVNNLVISLITQNEIRSLRNSDYFKIQKGLQRKVEIKTLEEFRSILSNDFNLSFNHDEASLLFEKYIKS